MTVFRSISKSAAERKIPVNTRRYNSLNVIRITVKKYSKLRELEDVKNLQTRSNCIFKELDKQKIMRNT